MCDIYVKSDPEYHAHRWAHKHTCVNDQQESVASILRAGHYLILPT